MLIGGFGPASLTLTAQLAVVPDITTRIINRKTDPLQIGRADGIACRGMEMFQALGVAERAAHKGRQVNEFLSGRCTVGVEVRYRGSRIEQVGSSQQALAQGNFVGKRFQSAPAIRVAVSKSMELGHVLVAEGRRCVMLFAPQTDRGDLMGEIAKLCVWLGTDADSPVRRVTPKGAPTDAVIDVRAIFQVPHHHRSVLGRFLEGVLPRVRCHG